MGDRANVKWVDSDDGVLHFYTHWSGYKLQATVAAALNRGRNRWDDDQYLARIVFCEMIQDDVVGGETGFGLATYVGDGEDRIVTVNTKTQTVVDFAGVEHTFENYIQSYLGREDE